MRALGRTRRRDERGGAISLWVVLMVPVSAFAAVVAMAVPQRLAAESSVQEAADDLAMLAVAWRDGQGAKPKDMEEGSLYAFPPDCSTDGQRTHFDADIDGHQNRIDDYQNRIDNFPLPAEPLTEPQLRQQQSDERQELTRLERLRTVFLGELQEACELLFEALTRDLGYLGVDVVDAQGFYSDSLTMSAAATVPKPPCRASERMVVTDAVHVALAADWRDAGWAAAQVWPDGTRVAGQSVGRLTRADRAAALAPCGEALTVLDEQGRPVIDPAAQSRDLTGSVPRTPLAG